MRASRWLMTTALSLIAFACAACFGCSGTTPVPDAMSAVDAATARDLFDSDAAAANLVALIGGRWHGKINPNYSSGCLCLNLDATGTITDPSGITLNFAVTSWGDGNSDTTVLDLAARKVTIRMLINGANFYIKNATVDADGKMMQGDWLGDSPGPFDGTIWLDRDPASCKMRTRLDGAPC